MSVCGADITGSDLILVTVEKGEDESFVVNEIKCSKISLADGDQATVRVFARALAGFVRSHGIKNIALRGRMSKGPFAGGPASFKIEALVQALEDCDVSIIMPTSISAQLKKKPVEPPKALHKYRHNAFLTACVALMKIGK